MSRVLALGGIALTIAASVGLYQVKYQVQGMERDLAQMKRDVVRDRGEIQVLEAEWSYLNQPERLQDLANRYLSLAPATTAQMAAIEDLPPRAAAPAPGVADAGSAATSNTPKGKAEAKTKIAKEKLEAKAEIAKAKAATKATSTSRVASAPSAAPSLAVRAPAGLAAGVPAAATVMVSGGAVAPAPLQGGDDE
jgi:hypothetical protein